MSILSISPEAVVKSLSQPAKKNIKDKIKRKKDRDFDDEAESEQFLWSSGTEMSCEYLDFAKFKHGTDVKKELDDLREAVVAVRFVTVVAFFFQFSADSDHVCTVPTTGNAP